jgi:hypothetical protein
MDMEEFVEDRVHVDCGEVEKKVKRRREIAEEGNSCPIVR